MNCGAAVRSSGLHGNATYNSYKYNVEWKNRESKEDTLYDSIYRKFKSRQSSSQLLEVQVMVIKGGVGQTGSMSIWMAGKGLFPNLGLITRRCSVCKTSLSCTRTYMFLQVFYTSVKKTLFVLFNKRFCNTWISVWNDPQPLPHATL